MEENLKTEVIAIIGADGSIEFTGQPFLIGAILGAARKLQSIAEGQVVTPRPLPQGAEEVEEESK